MKNKTVLDILKDNNAVITNDHFVYTSNRHGSVYINKDVIYPHTKVTSAIGKIFAQTFKDLAIDAVVAPAIGGIVLSQWTAHHLTILKKKEILGMYTEKNLEKNQIFTRGYDKLIEGKRVLIIEDITTTGGSVKKVITSVQEHGGSIVAIGVMVNRDPVNVTYDTFGYPFTALSELFVESFDQKDCPMCKKNTPINTSVGHGKKFLVTQR
jgi:orotate phosphoribosyltransferase